MTKIFVIKLLLLILSSITATLSIATIPWGVNPPPLPWFDTHRTSLFVATTMTAIIALATLGIMAKKDSYD